MKNSIIMYLCIVIFSSYTFSQNSEYLQIGNVQASWYVQPGSIDSVTVMIEPKGYYAEVQMLVDYSTRCTNFNPHDSLEIQMGFHLPYEAEVTDLWLWFFDLPIQARMLDRWTASMIYEDIVGRREDPVLLLKNSDTYYEMKIFPLMTNMPRRIKLTYMVPLHSLTSNQSFLSLPINFFRLSHCPILRFKVGMRNHPDLNNPSLIEYPTNTFSPYTDPYFGECLMTELSSIPANALNIKFQHPTYSSEIFAGTTAANESGNGFYQIELNLKEIFSINKPKKTLFLFDFIATNSTISKQEVLSTFKSYIPHYYTTGDSLNIMFGGFYTNTLSPDWVAADSVSLTQFLNSMNTSHLSSSSNLHLLLIDAIQFVRNNGNDAQIFLISSSNNYQNINAANNFVNTILSSMGMPRIPIHIISLDNKSPVNWNNWPNVLRGSEYMFSRLSQFTGGEFEIIVKSFYNEINWWDYTYYENYTPFDMMLYKILPKLRGYFSTNNVFVAMQSGLTYSSYNLTNVNGFIYFDSPFRIIGKYMGMPPFNIMIVAQDNSGQIYNSQLTIESQNITQLDTTSKHIWAGQHIRELYTFQQSNSIVSQIIQTSMSERVLSKYTALLAIEPDAIFSDTISIPPTENDHPSVGIENVQSDYVVENSLLLYPNPVSENLNFEIILQDDAEFSFEIFNILGQKTAEGNTYMYSGKNIYTYNLKHLPDGVYIVKVKINNDLKYTGKIVVKQ